MIIIVLRGKKPICLFGTRSLCAPGQAFPGQEKSKTSVNKDRISGFARSMELIVLVAGEFSLLSRDSESEEPSRGGI